MDRQRANNQPLNEDKTYAELAYYRHLYQIQEQCFCRKSWRTHMIARYSLPVMLFSLAAMFMGKYWNIVPPNGFSNLAFFKPYLPLILTLSLLIFAGALFANQISGYTKGWSRNRLMRKHLDRMIQIEQENMLAKLSELEEQNRIQTHKDIVGDYVAAHNNAVNWLKINKK